MALKVYDDYPFVTQIITSHEVEWMLEYRKDADSLHLLSVRCQGRQDNAWSTDLKEWFEIIAPDALNALDVLARAEIKDMYK